MQIGDKVCFVLQSYELTSWWDNPYGVTYLYTFRDFFDNVYIWKTSRVIEDNISKVSGRVKEFITYDGQQEIQLIYCKCS